jgi:hypothetical protein
MAEPPVNEGAMSVDFFQYHSMKRGLQCGCSKGVVRGVGKGGTGQNRVKGRVDGSLKG